MTHYFRISEELVSLTATEQDLLAVPNMAAFRTIPPTEDASACLFSLQVEHSIKPQDLSDFSLFLRDNSEPEMPQLTAYRNTDHWLIRVAQSAALPVCCELLTTADFRSATLFILSEEPCSRSTVRFAIDNATMLLYAFATAHNHCLEMHAAVVVHEGKARLFLGHSGTGKSTHARQWLAQYHQSYLLNDDNPILRLDDDGRLWVYGSPWSGKTPCYRNERVPVAAIMQLEQAPANAIEALSPAQAYAYILASCSGLKVLHDSMDGLHDTISHIVMNTKIGLLHCLPDKDAAMLCYDFTK